MNRAIIKGSKVPSNKEEDYLIVIGKQSIWGKQYVSTNEMSAHLKNLSCSYYRYVKKTLYKGAGII